MSISPEPWVDRLEAARAVARQGEDSEGIHQLRVAIRRLVTWLDLGGSEAHREQLQRLRRTVSRARDLDVLLERKKLPRGFRSWLRAGVAAERGAVLAALDDPDTSALIEGFRQEAPLDRDLALRGLRRLIRRALRRGEVLSQDVPEIEAVHDLRRAIRPVRYGLDWLGKPVDAVRPMQDALGLFNDASVLLDALAAWGGEAPALVARVRAEQAQALELARLLWPGVRAALEDLRASTRAAEGG